MNTTNQQESGSAVLERPEQKPLQYLTPLAEVRSTSEEFTLRVEMPGVEKSGLEITFEDGVLTIVGHRLNEDLSGKPLYREIRRYDYRRVYKLDAAVDASKIAARIDQGVLTLTLPRAESVKPRKISVE
jgi:HSP20 family protein